MAKPPAWPPCTTHDLTPLLLEPSPPRCAPAWPHSASQRSFGASRGVRGLSFWKLRPAEPGPVCPQHSDPLWGAHCGWCRPLLPCSFCPQTGTCIRQAPPSCNHLPSETQDRGGGNPQTLESASHWVGRVGFMALTSWLLETAQVLCWRLCWTRKGEQCVGVLGQVRGGGLYALSGRAPSARGPPSVRGHPQSTAGTGSLSFPRSAREATLLHTYRHRGSGKIPAWPHGCPVTSWLLPNTMSSNTVPPASSVTGRDDPPNHGTTCHALYHLALGAILKPSPVCVSVHSR